MYVEVDRFLKFSENQCEKIYIISGGPTATKRDMFLYEIKKNELKTKEIKFKSDLWNATVVTGQKKIAIFGSTKKHTCS